MEGQIITAVEDIKLFVFGDLKGVGKCTLGMLEEFIETGKIQRLEEMRPEERLDNMEWFSSLSKEQAGYIQYWWDERGKRKWCIGSGIPFTFEYDGDKYKADGTDELVDQEGACIGVKLDRNIDKNGVKYGHVKLSWEVDTFERDETYCAIIPYDESLQHQENEDLFQEKGEACLDEFHSNYEFPDNMAYRE